MDITFQKMKESHISRSVIMIKPNHIFVNQSLYYILDSQFSVRLELPNW
jgi:hypothetical protein